MRVTGSPGLPICMWRYLCARRRPRQAGRRYKQSMNLACLGGGPGGLCFAILARKAFPSASVEVWDRNPPGATYGFGVVFSDEAMEAIRRADAGLHDAIVRERASWGEIDVHFRDRVYTSGGHGFSALSRSRLVGLMQERAAGLGVVDRKS